MYQEPLCIPELKQEALSGSRTLHSQQSSVAIASMAISRILVGTLRLQCSLHSSTAGTGNL